LIDDHEPLQHLDSGAVPIDNKQAVLQATGMAPEDYIDGWFPLLPDRTDFVPGSLPIESIESIKL